MKERTRLWVLSVAVMICLTGCTQITEYKRLLLERAGTTQESRTQQETISLSDVVSFEEPGHSTYAYDCLSEAQKIWYEDMNTMLSKRSDVPATLSQEGFDMGLGEADIDIIFQSVLLDHPEYFYVEGYEYTAYSTFGALAGIELKGTYSLSHEECLTRKELIDEAVSVIVDKAPEDATDYAKIKYVYENVIYHTEYCMDAEDNQNIYSVFVGQKSVCQGYAKATQYLLSLLDVECTSVFGTVNTGEGHTWNLVKADGEYYFLDTTWGDASYLAGSSDTGDWSLPDINYDYLCITTMQLENTHKIEHPFELPPCVAKENNFYVKEGCYFEAYDEEQLNAVFAGARQDGKGYVTVKCSEATVYNAMLQELIINQQIFTYLEESCETIAYIENEQQLSLTFWMTN